MGCAGLGAGIAGANVESRYGVILAILFKESWAGWVSSCLLFLEVQCFRSLAAGV
jgi:hypothetical protein